MHALELHRLRLADTVAVLGAGTIGLLITQLAKLAGASQIIVSEPLAYRREAAKEMGATDVLDPNQVDPGKAVQDLTRGRGVDVVYEASGSTEALKQGMEMARFGGTYILVGLPVPDTVELPFTAARQRELEERGLDRGNGEPPLFFDILASAGIIPPKAKGQARVIATTTARRNPSWLTREEPLQHLARLLVVPCRWT